ncbi:hypothetical protein D3C80_1147750 [compost metagenome]
MLKKVGRTDEGITGDLATQGQFDLCAGATCQGQQRVGGAGQAVENALDMLDHLGGGGMAAGAQVAIDLPVHHCQATRHRDYADRPGQQGAPAPAGAASSGKGHAGLM